MDELSKTLCSSSYAKDNGVLLYNNDVYIREDTPALALLEVRRVLGRAFVPVTLTADAALLLAKMKDADLAPLEAAAEDAGVDPAHYYTTHTLCDAFLAKCDQARMQSFAPLFEGSADAARAALAALLPNTFLQALVWRTLTTPEAELLPEVTEHESV